MEKTAIDARGKQCPIPVIETKKALEAMRGTGIVETRVDNMTAAENLRRFASSVGGRAEIRTNAENDYTVTLTAENAQAALSAADTGCYSGAPSSPDFVAAYASDKMGEGDEELGRILIKGFTYALSQLPRLPRACLFYNGGARLTCEGSELLEDLSRMESEGVDIITCGTCADFYKIRDRVRVGRIGNMYDIVETMANAAKVIRP